MEDVGHTLVLGATGSGKSFLLNFIVTNAQQYDPFTIVLDLGHGYRKLAALLHGGYVELGGDLQPFVTVIDRSVPLARGGRASIDLGHEPGHADTERLSGPPGWLGDVADGDLVGLRLVDGLLRVTPRPTPAAAGAAASAFAAAAGRTIELRDAKHDLVATLDIEGNQFREVTAGDTVDAAPAWSPTQTSTGGSAR